VLDPIIMSWERLLDKAGSFRNLFAMARKGGADAVAEIQKAMSLDSELFGKMGFRVEKVAKGKAELSFPFSRAAGRRGGIVHGGIIMYSLDNACGLAVMTVNPGVDQLTIDLKVSFLEPLKKAPFRAIGRVLRAGGTVAVAEGEVRDAAGRLCAKSLGTWYMLKKRG